MNRRTFLKSLTAACGAAVVCPGELLKSPVITPIIAGIDADAPMRWKHYYIEYHYSDFENKRLLEKLRAAFKVHPFGPPLIIGAYDEKIQTTHRPNPLCGPACDSSD